MSTRPRLVSIGMPLYNEGRYLPQAFDSFLGQDFQDLEIIMSDNASTDATRETTVEADTILLAKLPLVGPFANTTTALFCSYEHQER